MINWWWHIDDYVYWIMYRAGSTDCHWSGLSDYAGHSGTLGEWWYIHCDELTLLIHIPLLAHLLICCLCLYCDCGSVVRVSLYLWSCTLFHYLLNYLHDNWVNQYRALCHFDYASLIELSIEIFYEHLIYSCIILDPVIMYVSTLEVGRLTWQ